MWKVKKRLKWLVPVGVLAALAVAFFIYAGVYYHADETALAALASGGSVTVEKTGYGWRFDGPSETDALIFYPGAKVEETACAPLLRRIAEGGMDVCLVKMPFRLAFFGLNSADAVMNQYNYERWSIAGHSLGGAMAADYAARHPEELNGVALLAAYPTRELDDGLTLVSIYGTEDGVLNMDKVAAGDRFAPDDYVKEAIEGGNHAQFGSYGAQAGDGAAAITAEEQQRQTAELITLNLLK